MYDDFIERLRQFVISEAFLEVNRVEEMWNKPLKMRVAEGEAIDNIKIVDFNGYSARLRCENNISRFRPGDILILHKDDYYDGKECTLTEDLDSELVITAGFRQNFYDLKKSAGWILDRNYIDNKNSILRVLSLIGLYPHLAEKLKGILFGQIPRKIDNKKKSKALKTANKLKLDPSQCEAFAEAYATDNYDVIQGPPGTGKTWVLAYLAAELAKEGQKVFVTAFTHRAINNALNKIVRITGYGNVIKVGKKQYSDDLVLVNNNEKFQRRSLKTSDGIIIGATCYGVQSDQGLNKVGFDTIIIDEAAQVPIHLAISAMIAGKRHIFIGDHKQMEPIVLGDYKKDAWAAKSVFETIFTHTPGTMLETTYRMNLEINEFPSKRFYGGRLSPSKDAAKRRLTLSRKPRRYAELLNPDIPEIFMEVNHAGCSMRSPEEAEIAAGVAAEALECGVSPDEIAIIAIYRAQGRLIRKRLIELASEMNKKNLPRIVVDTVERIQGQERDIVIVSLTASDLSHAEHGAEFFLKPNRLNVSLTRARVKRIVIGSSSLFKSRISKREHRDWLAHFKAFYEQSYRINANVDTI